mgnify:FL=1
MIIQIIGACMILLNINSNLGTFKKGSIISIIIDYFKSFPLFMKSHTIYAAGIQSQASVGCASIGVVVNKPQSIEKRLSAIEKQLTDQFILINSIQNEVNKKIESIKESVEYKTSQLRQELDQVQSKILDAVVGGLDWQVFGFSLIIYGACITIW